MDREANQIIKDFKKTMKKRYPNSKILLFGSRARGDNLKGSDFDFIIIDDSFKEKQMVRRLEEVYDFWTYKYNADIIPYTQNEFNEFSKEICIAGKAKEEGIFI
jgi:uncharacterized protein